MKGLFDPELVAAIEAITASLTDLECRAAIARALERMDARQLQTTLGFVAGMFAGLDGEEIVATMRALIGESEQRGRPS